MSRHLAVDLHFQELLSAYQNICFVSSRDENKISKWPVFAFGVREPRGYQDLKNKALWHDAKEL